MGSIRVDLSFIHGSQKLHSEVQSIAGELHSGFPSVKKVHQLTHALDQTSSALQAMKDKVGSVFGQSREDGLGKIEEEIVHLYGEIHDVLIDREISQIRKEACSLQKSIDEGHPRAKEIDALRRHISHFLHDHRPSLSDRQVIAKAKETIEEAKRLSRHSAKNEVVEQVMIEVDLSDEEYEELLDIAAFVYDAKFKQAKALYNPLSFKLKQTLLAHMRVLGGSLFEDQTKTMQALIATVNQIVGNGERYPTPAEISDLFSGLKEVVDDFSWKPKRSLG